MKDQQVGLMQQDLSTTNRNKWLMLCSKAFKEYTANGKTLNDFEIEYDCSIQFTSTGHYISDVWFRNDSCKTMFMLKYNL